MPFQAAAGEAAWTKASEADFAPDPDRHIIYWIRLIKEDISTEEQEEDIRGLKGLGINRAVALMEVREAIYESARQAKFVELD